MVKVICNYCGKEAEFVDSSTVYGRSYGMIYLCRSCNAYVGVHKGTGQPLGRLANAELRRWKIAAHDAFDPMWKSGPMTRNAAYRYLSHSMGLTKSETHIGMFDVQQCQKVIEICNDWRKMHEPRKGGCPEATCTTA